jgi:acetyl esterase/lipase
MSWRRALLNTSLRWFEKPHLARAATPEVLRKSFEMKARVWFHPPRGTHVRRDRVGQVPATWVAAREAREDRVILYLHGGGYVFGSSRTHQGMLGHLSAHAGAVACLPDYRLAPEHPFPAAIEDARAAWDGLQGEGFAPGQIVIGGDSAGGGLALALLGDLIARGAALPAAVFALSPLTDMTFSGESMRGNAQSDVVLPASRAQEAAEMYLGTQDARDPLASPLFAEFAGAPPVYITAGTTEILLDDTRRMAESMREQGVDVREVILEDVPHVWPLFQGLIPEARQTLREIGQWLSPLWQTKADS